jgi:hypothetical protein
VRCRRERVRVKERCSDRCPSSAVYAGAFGAQMKWRWDELRRRQASAVLDGTEQGKASLVVARVVCAVEEGVSGSSVLWGDGNAGMLTPWCVQVGR